MASHLDWNGPKAPDPVRYRERYLQRHCHDAGQPCFGSAPCFHDVRTYWSPEACERVTGQKPDGVAANGFIHLINSGATALDGSGACVDAEGNHVMKPFWGDDRCGRQGVPERHRWCRAGTMSTCAAADIPVTSAAKAEMPVTMLRFNIVKGIGPCLQIAEG